MIFLGLEMENEETPKRETLTFRMRENPWILSTFVLGLLVLILLVPFAGLTGNTISEKDAGEKLIAYYESVGATGLSLNSVGEESGMYKIILNYQGSEIPFYVTKSGYIIGNNLVSITEDATSSSSSNTQTTEVPKTTKPSVELYVFTYCPYGLQMEKATIPVAKLLAGKIDFKIRQIGAMHGDYEKVEAERQLCIEKNYPDKFLDYVLAFAENTEIGNCKGDATCLTPKINALYTKLGIDAKKINSCMTSEGEDLYNAEVQNSNSKGVSGSPTVLVNGVSSSMSRSPAGVLDGICQTFADTSVPQACATQLSSTSSVAGFGAGTSSSSSSGTQCATA